MTWPAPKAYTHLFVAHALGLAATGIATVALALLAFDLAGYESGAVLGTALSLKMAVNVIVPLITSAEAVRMTRRTWLVVLNLVRAGVLALLPFVTQIWQIFVLIVFFETAAAAFRASYVAIVPDLLHDEDAYARAVAKSQVAYNVESMLSPILAAALLGVLSFRGVFIASLALFVIGALIVAMIPIPEGRKAVRKNLFRTLANFRFLMSTPALGGAIVVSFASITITAMVVVNTVVLVRGAFNLHDTAAAIGLSAFGLGGIASAILTPGHLLNRAERSVVIGGGAAMAALLALGAWLPGYFSMLALWVALGAASTSSRLPLEPLLRRISVSGDRQGIYAAYYFTSNTVLMLAYLAAGWVGAELGMASAFLGLGLFSATLVAVAIALWPKGETLPIDVARQ
jgi:Major Facilitator Superfamily